MARLEDVYRGLRAEDLPDELQEPLRPLLATIDSALTAIWNAVAGGNLTLTENVAVEKIECQLSHGVTQVVLLKKLKRAGCIVGYSAGEDASGVGHAFLIPPIVQPASAPGMAQITAYFRNNTAKRVACTFYVAPDGTNSSKTKSTAPYVSLTSDVTGVLPEANGGTNQSTYAKGDTLYASAVNTLSKLTAGTSGYVYTMQGTGVPGWSPASGSGGVLTGAFIVAPHRKGGFYRPLNTGGTQDKMGMSVPSTLSGAVTNVELSDRLAAAFPASGTAPGGVGGFAGPFTETEPRYKPYMSVTGIWRDAASYKLREWIGFFSASPVALAVLNNTSGASAIKFAAIGMDLNVSANIMLCSGDGVNYSCADTGIAIGSNGDPQTNFIIDWSTSGTLTASIQRVGGAVTSLGTKTSNLLGGTDSTKLGIVWSNTVITNTHDPTQYISSVYVEQN